MGSFKNYKLSIFTTMTFQIRLLTILGFLPPNRENCCTSVLGVGVAIAVLLGSWFCAGLQAGGFYFLISMSGFFDSTVLEKPVNPLIKAFTWTPFLFINLRAALVMTIFLVKRNKWQEVVRMADDLMLNFYGSAVVEYLQFFENIISSTYFEDVI